MPLDLDVLRLLRAVAEEGSVSAAARRLGVSQPAASQQLRRAERVMGTALVERVGRRSRPTEPGRVLARHAVAVEALLDAAEREVRAVAGLAAGTVRLVAFPSASARLVPRSLAALRRAHPGLQVALSEVEPPDSVGLVRAGDADVVVTFAYDDDGGGGDGDRDGDDRDDRAPGTGPGSDLNGLHAVPLLLDEVRVALPRSHPAAARASLPLAELADEDWIGGCPRCRGRLVHLAERSGFRPRLRYETDDYVAVLGLVAEGLGVALLPGLADVHLVGHDVVTVPLEPVERRRVLAVTTPDLARVPGVVAVLDALVHSAAAASPPG